MTSPTFSGATVQINNAHVTFPIDIREVLLLSNVVVVLLNYNTGRKEEKYGNIFGYDLEGNRLWEAELPIGKKYAVYSDVKNSDDVYCGIYKKRKKWQPWSFKLMAYSFGGYDCEIDMSSGQIKKLELS